MKIDVHCHILPSDWPDLRDRYGYGGWIRLEHTGPGCANMWKDEVFFRAVESDLWDPDRRLEFCGEHRVDVQVLSTVPVMFGYWAKAEDALDLARFLNDHIAGCVERYPKRFIGLGTVPMQDPELAARELERCVTQLGLAGIEVGSHVGAHNLHEERFDPLWAKADELGAAVFVHPWDMMGMDTMPRMPNGDWHLWMPWLVSMPAETVRAAISLTMGGVMDRYPRVRFLLAHGGGAFLATMGRIKHGFDVRPDLCQTHTKNPPDSYLDRLYFDALVHDPDALEFMLRKTTAERIALGTDYPFPLGELAPGKLVEGMDGLSPETKDRILSGTALEWLGRARADYETEASLAHSRWLGCSV